MVGEADARHSEELGEGHLSQVKKWQRAGLKMGLITQPFRHCPPDDCSLLRQNIVSTPVEDALAPTASGLKAPSRESASRFVRSSSARRSRWFEHDTGVEIGQVYVESLLRCL